MITNKYIQIYIYFRLSISHSSPGRRSSNGCVCKNVSPSIGSTSASQMPLKAKRQHAKLLDLAEETVFASAALLKTINCRHIKRAVAIP